MSGSSPTLRRAIGAVFAGGLCIATAACRDDSGGATAAFCEQVEEHLDELRATPQTIADVEALIALWKDVGEVAPLAIEADWDAHVLNFETALEGDDDEEIYARIYATERSSLAVGAWVQANCGFDWGPITTIVPAAPTTTTVPGASTTTTVAASAATSTTSSVG
jgi:hypothetical protein